MLWTMHYLTLDGVMADPHLWHPDHAGPDAYDLTLAHVEEADAMRVGRPPARPAPVPVPVTRRAPW
jgi:hypothetical protein